MTYAHKQPTMDEFRRSLRSYTRRPSRATSQTPLTDRLVAYIDYPGNDADCWPWMGAQQGGGYGVVGVKGKSRRVHRVIFEILVGPIIPGLVLDHLCRNRACCNPAHLEPVTNRVNLLRGIGLTAVHAAKTHCIHGHELTPENTYHPPKRPNGRCCRVCRRRFCNESSRRRRARA